MSLLSFAKKIASQQEAKKPSGKKTAAKKTATKTKVDTPAKETATPVIMVNHAGIIGLIPLVTEKSVAANNEANTVMFRVTAKATKGQISTAVIERYKVKPIAVRTIIMNPKNRRRGQTEGRTNIWKKAYVKLPAGKTIDLTV